MAEGVEAVYAGRLVEDVVHQALDAAGVVEAGGEGGEVGGQGFADRAECPQVLDDRPGLDQGYAADRGGVPQPADRRCAGPAKRTELADEVADRRGLAVQVR